MSEKEPVSVQYFVHEAVVSHMNRCNKRMLVALLSVCITFILTITIFVVGFTVRNKQYIDCIEKLTAQQGVVASEGLPPLQQ